MEQTAFADLEYRGKERKTRREPFPEGRSRTSRRARTCAIGGNESCATASPAPATGTGRFSPGRGSSPVFAGGSTRRRSGVDTSSPMQPRDGLARGFQAGRQRPVSSGRVQDEADVLLRETFSPTEERQPYIAPQPLNLRPSTLTPGRACPRVGGHRPGQLDPSAGSGGTSSGGKAPATCSWPVNRWWAGGTWR